ncbi:hypothetical protein QL285_003788 [Trifolium repens]|nr:hypothetical protein QL285_003788 [Trifolium repens]
MQAKQQILDLLDLIHGTDMCWPRTAGSGRLVVRLGGGERESWKMKANTRSVSIETEIPRGLPASECVRQHRLFINRRLLQLQLHKFQKLRNRTSIFSKQNCMTNMDGHQSYGSIMGSPAEDKTSGSKP